MKNKNEIKTGILVVIGIGLFIFGFSYLKSNDIFLGDRTFYAVYDDVEGVVNGTPVTVNGFPVGSIQDISFLKNNNLLVKFRVENDLTFSINSIAQIYETGLIGGKALSIIPANDNSRIAVSRDTLESSVAPGLTEIIKEKLTPLQENIESMIVSANEVLSRVSLIFDDSTRTNLKTIVSDFTETIRDLKETSAVLKSNKLNIDKIIDNALDISTDLSEISKTINQSELDLIISNFKIFSNDLALILEKINDSNGTFSKLIENDTLFQNLNNASKSIDLLLEDIRLNPKRYIHFSIFGKKDKVYQSKSK